MPAATLHIGCDTFLEMLDPAVDAKYGLLFDLDPDEERRLIHVSKEKIGEALYPAMHTCMRTLLDTGFNLVIDEVLFSDEDWKDYQHRFVDFTVYFIAVKPPIEVVEQRVIVKRCSLVRLVGCIP